MRLHKQNTHDYELFYKVLENYSELNKGEETELTLIHSEENSNTKMAEKYSHMFQNLMLLENETAKIKEPEKIVEKLKISLKRILPVKDADLLFFDETTLNLNSFGKDNSPLCDRMNYYHKEGLLDILFESGKSMLLPELKSYNAEGSKLNYVVFPVYEGSQEKGLLCILSSIGQRKFNAFDRQIIQMLLNLTLAKVDKLILREELNNTYEDLQIYQAKLSNDFRLAAIGELTEGIVEDISTPLQVIMSHADLIDNKESKYEVNKIKQQVKKINSTINRLVKFSNLNQKNIKIQPCNINSVIRDYYNIVKSTLDSINLEFVLDFEPDIPSILSHPNYIFQLLTNIIGLIKNNNKGEGGIVIQTGYAKESIRIKLISTAKLKNKENSSELSIKIVENLMNKHEGSFSVESFEEGSSTITLEFPLKRKIRK